MKASSYNLSTEHPETGQLILFNALYGSTVIVEPENKQLILAILDKPDSAPNESQELLRFHNELVRLKFLVENERDELSLVLNRKRAGMSDKNRLDVIVMPNLNCNFACPYCYEKHSPDKTMSVAVRSNLLMWLDRTIPGHKVVLLNWFGGEPLLDLDTICAVTSSVRKKCDEEGIKLLTNITSNGYLLSEGAIGKLIALEMLSFQITVDGPPETHNRTRVLRSGKGTFDRIYSNIVNLTRADRRVKVSLRVNYNHNNLYQIPELLTLFPSDICPQLRVVFEPIFGDETLSATRNIDGAEISRAVTKYYELAASMGYDVRLGGLGVGKLVYCYAERENQYIIDYKGDVFKCSVSEFESSGRVGFIGSDGDFERDESRWSRWFGMPLVDQKCQECVFLPLCMGGCRKDRMESGATGSYCSLVPTNASQALKAVAFGAFHELLRREVKASRCVARGPQAIEARG